MSPRALLAGVLALAVLAGCTPAPTPSSASAAPTGITDGPPLPTPGGRTRELEQVRTQFQPMLTAVLAATVRAVGPVDWEERVDVRFGRSLSHTCAVTLGIAGLPSAVLPAFPSTEWMREVSDAIAPSGFQRIERPTEAADMAPRLQSANHAENAMLIIDQRSQTLLVLIEVGSATGC